MEVSQDSSESTNPKLLPADIDHAESTLVKHAQEELHSEIRKGKYKELLRGEWCSGSWWKSGKMSLCNMEQR